MPAIVLAVVAAFSRWIALEGAKWLAKKALLLSLIVLVLPVVLKNVIHWFMDISLQILQAAAPQLISMDSFTVELWSVGAYLGSTMMLDSCMAIILTGLAVRITLNFIPLIK